MCEKNASERAMKIPAYILLITSKCWVNVYWNTLIITPGERQKFFSSFFPPSKYLMGNGSYLNQLMMSLSAHVEEHLLHHHHHQQQHESVLSSDIWPTFQIPLSILFNKFLHLTQFFIFFSLARSREWNHLWHPQKGREKIHNMQIVINCVMKIDRILCVNLFDPKWCEKSSLSIRNESFFLIYSHF